MDPPPPEFSSLGDWVWKLLEVEDGDLMNRRSVILWGTWKQRNAKLWNNECSLSRPYPRLGEKRSVAWDNDSLTCFSNIGGPISYINP